MKGKMKPVLSCTVSAVALSMIASLGTMAASNTEIENSKWSYRAVADVTTQVNIRANASTDSTIVGYLPKAAAADVIERGEEWSHIISGGVEGYIKNEYLAYGADAKFLAEVYGKQGVEVSWDDVNMFSKPDACSNIVKQAQGGSEYELLNDEGLWYSVQASDGTVAYVPAEDVQETIILDKAIPVVTTATASPQTEGTYTDTSTDASYNDTSSDTSYEDNSYQETSETSAWTEDTSTETEYTEPPADETSYQETEAQPETEAQQPETAPAESPETSQTEPASEETVTNASTDDVSLLAALIYCEAGNQSREGKVAVGAVVMNRIASSSYPSTISDVIYQSGQFAPAITGWLGQVLSSGASSDCYEAAQAALNGENPVPGALYFNNSAGKGTKIGDHWFY